MRKSLLSKFRKFSIRTNSSDEIDDTLTIWFNLPFLGTEGEHLVKKCIKEQFQDIRQDQGS